MRAKYLFRAFVLLSLTYLSVARSYSQNSLVLNGAYIVFSGGTAARNIYMVVDQPSTSGIIRPGGGHIISEGQYNYVKWTSGTSTGAYVFPFGVGGNPTDYIPFTFNKTSTGNSDISTSTWTTDQKNEPHPTISNVGAVTNMKGVPDSVVNAIDRFWDIQSASPVKSDLTFSYRGLENTTFIPGDTIKAQHWNGTSWDVQAGPGNPGLTTGIGTVGPIPGQSTFSPWVLTRDTLKPLVISSVQNLNCNNVNAGTATASTSGGLGPYTYSWTGGQKTQVAVGLAAGTYVVTITDAKGSTTTSSVTITSPAPITTTIATVKATCGGSDGSAVVTALGGAGNYSYGWSTNASGPTANNLSAGNYNVTVTDINGCSTITTAVINNNGGPSVSSVNSGTILCKGASTGSATVSISPSTGPYTYSWSNGTSGTTTSLTNSVNSLPAKTYSVTVTDANGCITTTTVTVGEPITGLAINNITAGKSSCGTSDGSVVATAIGGTGNYSYSWSNGETSAKDSLLSAGTYTVTATDGKGCTQTQTAAVMSSPGPTGSISASALTIKLGASVTLTAAGGNTYLWNPSSTLTCVNCAITIATPKETTTYCVLVTDKNNCKDSVCTKINVEIPCGQVAIPSAFSPNGDNTNDLECVYGNCIETLHLVIFDRWGEKVFETTDPKQCWDGTYQGTLENTAVFVYQLEATTTGGDKVVKSGNISLIR